MKIVGGHYVADYPGERIDRPDRWNHGLTAEEVPVAARLAQEMEAGRRDPKCQLHLATAARRLMKEWKQEELRESRCIARAECDME